MAFNTTQALETTVLTDKTLANATLGVIYAVFTAFAIVAPKVVDYLGPRLAMMIGAVPYVLVVFANMAPSWGTLIPASAGVGAGAAILWTGQGIYMSRCAVRESAQTGEPVDQCTSRMNGLFWTAFQFNGAVGLIASSLILQSVDTASSNFGAVVKYMFGGFGAVGCLGIGILTLVRSAPPLSDAEGLGGADAGGGGGGDEEEGAPLTAGAGAGGAGGESKKEPVSLVATLRLLWASAQMKLLVPLIFYNGLCLGFNAGTYPLLYADSSSEQKLLPASAVGYVAACFYLANSASSFLWGKVVIPRIGRRPLFLLTGLTHALWLGMTLALSRGYLLPGSSGSGSGMGGPVIAHGSPAAYALCLMGSIVFALGDSVLESQIPAIVQSPSFFPVERDRDAANSNVRMWQSLGFATQFGLSIACGPFTQSLYQAGMLTLALACLYACDKYARPIEASAAAGLGGKEEAYSKVAGGEED